LSSIFLGIGVQGWGFGELELGPTNNVALSLFLIEREEQKLADATGYWYWVLSPGIIWVTRIVGTAQCQPSKHKLLDC